jgi:endonuclease/exonuclease/phosphatase family metal-dependent hydrolase
MRIVALNVENLFSRAKALNGEDMADNKVILTAFSRLNVLLEKPTYSDADKTKILDELKTLGLLKSDESKFALLRQNKGKLIKRPRSGSPTIEADGRGDWIGWVDLTKEAVNETATQMTAKVIAELNPDILAVVEAEDRVALHRFNVQLLKPVDATFGSIMLIDGNDERGIDVGLMTKPGFAIQQMRSHVDDDDGDGLVFSRDCPEYHVALPSGETLLVMINHLKSKGFGTPADSNARRRRQAQRVREIYDERRAAGIDHIAIVGDFNDTPGSDPLEPLLGNGSDLQDITDHPTFVSDGRPGTYKNGTASQKIDYILLSPALFANVMHGEIFRKGVWGGTHGTLFPHFPEMTKAIHAASDHAAIVADINL